MNPDVLFELVPLEYKRRCCWYTSLLSGNLWHFNLYASVSMLALMMWLGIEVTLFLPVSFTTKRNTLKYPPTYWKEDSMLAPVYYKIMSSFNLYF
jgi:hypothetical protein